LRRQRQMCIRDSSYTCAHSASARDAQHHRAGHQRARGSCNASTRPQHNSAASATCARRPARENRRRDSARCHLRQT
ncbi:hypothetical protein, partial [Limnohabitans sp.]|uniref:hypothetical protein n=1 Tax=Limnohabitans sp. TaxID=1907725 RepID=UPI0038BBCD6C